jgi:hypothetical protein
MKTVTLLVIHHTDSGPSLESLWIFPGDGRADRSERKWPGWIEIVEPIGSNRALEISDSLSSFFRSNGVEVILEAIAD